MSDRTADQAEANRTADPRLPAALLVNTASRRGRDEFETAKSRLLERGLQLVGAHAVDDPARFTELADAAIDDGAQVVVLGGGDGTVSHLAARLAERDVVLGLLPTGTANDLARTLGLPTDITAACDVVLDGRVARIDLGAFSAADGGSDVFLNLASIGLAVEVTRALSPRLKRRIGAAAYPVAAVQAYFGHRPFRARLEFPHGDHPDVELDDLLQVGVANGRFYGGGAVAAPDAGIDDHLLDVYAIPRGTALQRFTVATHFVSGAFTQADHVLHVTTRAVRVSTVPHLMVNMDGELSARTPVDFSIRAAALKVLVPEPAQS